MPTYTFTQAQLYHVLSDTIAKFQEYRDKHGKAEPLALNLAVQETIDDLDTERELYHAGEIKRPGQMLEKGL